MVTPITFSRSLTVVKMKSRSQEVLKTGVNRSRGTFRLGQTLDSMIAGWWTTVVLAMVQKVKQSILSWSKGQALKWWVKNF